MLLPTLTTLAGATARLSAERTREKVSLSFLVKERNVKGIDRCTRRDAVYHPSSFTCANF